MTSQRLARINKKTNRYRPTAFKKASFQHTPIRDGLTDFIHHPTGFPIEFKRLWFSDREDKLEMEKGDIGLIFESEKYMKPGINLEITIPLRQETEKFRGKVVLVRQCGDYYEIGLWLKHRSDASRVRIVEQICHIETYLKDKKYREGPYCINRERVAEEWITKYASSVPSL